MLGRWAVFRITCIKLYIVLLLLRCWSNAAVHQPVVRGPLVVLGHLPGGPRAKPDICVHFNEIWQFN